MKKEFLNMLAIFLLFSLSVLGQNKEDFDDAYIREMKVENNELSNRIKSLPLIFKQTNTQISMAIRAEDYPTALKLALKLDSLYPNNPDVKNFSGKMLAKVGNINAAIASFDKAIKLNPNNKWFYINKAGILADNDRKEEALKTIEKLNILFPKWSIGYNYKGALLHSLGKNKEALKAYSSAVNNEPKSALILSNRGDLYLYLKDNVKALDDYKKALAIQPDYSRAKLKIDSISN